MALLKKYQKTPARLRRTAYLQAKLDFTKALIEKFQLKINKKKE